jgi:hypothetical protein
MVVVIHLDFARVRMVYPRSIAFGDHPEAPSGGESFGPRVRGPGFM